MSILVKGMAMPKSCEECPCFDEGLYYCNVKKENLSERLFDHTKDPPPNWCPLIELPPHGKWILHNMGFGFTHHCSNCHFEVKEQWIGFYNFCPHCGADMREESEDIPMEYFESGGK